MSYKPYEFDPFKVTGVDPSTIPARDLGAAMRDAAEFAKEKVLSNTAAGRTSVDGGVWKKKLSKEYKGVKAEESSVTYANLELTGQMMDSFDASVSVRRRTITLEVDEDQEGKADGNLTGSYGKGRADYSRAREFMPHRRGQKLTPEIIEGMRKILERYGKG